MAGRQKVVTVGRVKAKAKETKRREKEKAKTGKEREVGAPGKMAKAQVVRQDRQHPKAKVPM